MTPVEAMQTTLAGEHAALYLYGVVGGRLSAADAPALTDLVNRAYVEHRRRRDQLTEMVRASGADPVAGRVSYELPNPCRTTRQLRAAALDVEERCSEVYAAMVGATARAQRQWAIDALGDSAVRLLGFGGTPAPFPGVPGI
jgi:hypothetical protein